MSAPKERAGRPPLEESPPDELWARAYAEGFGEGVRDALKEILQHAARGHTAQELRLLVESRLARVSEEVDLKRRSLLAPPRRASWGPLLRPPANLNPAGAGGPTETVLAPALGHGVAVLFREERPVNAVRYLRESAPRFEHVALVSQHPPEIPGSDPASVTVIRPGVAAMEGATGGPGEILGEIRLLAERHASVLVYVDALEFLVTEFSAEAALRAVNWLSTNLPEKNSSLVVSVDPQAFDTGQRGRLQRAFQYVL
ncbi:MAG: DUF835 domain-containing protein [Thermoplasmata archaeon]|nr:DUF835 domain-containing protein [Thermoplasmata archaeon]